MIIGRSETQVEIDSKIDISAKEFQKLESPDGIQEENRSYEGEGDVLPVGENLGRPHSEMFEGGETERAERPRKKRSEKAKPLEVELDLGGDSKGGMLRSSLENGKGSHLVALSNFKQQEDVKMYIQLPEYDDSQCYDLGMGCALNHVARQIYANFRMPSRRTLKRQLPPVGIKKTF